ncbi:MAG: winged helix-turn-helix transcriptional regulator [Deltaproteobacteria bacterium]|nr:winged helix-turn-helix transcriptional regulator [Deltaproteobacteria bacterium]
MIPKEIYEIHAGICRCLASPKRLEILDILRDRELSASEIAERLSISGANASQHLAMMKEKGILKCRRDGVSLYYSIAYPKVLKACEIMREVLFEVLNERQRLADKVRF